MTLLTSLLPSAQAVLSEIDWLTIVKAAAFLALGIFLVGALFRMLFGKGSALTGAVSASLSILLVYLAVVLIHLFLPAYRDVLEPLPFMTVTSQHVFLTDVAHMAREVFFPAVLRLSILAFLVNLLEEILPDGEKLLTWYLWRTVTVLASLAGYAAICAALNQLAPQILGDWAIYIICGFWALILLTGLIKVLLGLVLTVINPIIGGLYALFFSRFLGKQISKSILTTCIVMAVFWCLFRSGLSQFAFSEFSLAAYGPSCIILLIALYLFGRFL